MRIWHPCLLAVLLAGVACQGTSPPATEPTPTPAPVCGDGILQPPEECDDGNADNNDACLVGCLTPPSWVTSDPHMHGWGCEQTQRGPEDLVRVLVDNDINVGAALVWGESPRVERELLTGQDSPASLPDHILHYDMEISHWAAQQTGHLVLLGLHEGTFSSNPKSSPKSGLRIVDWARAQGARVVVGMAHVQMALDGYYPDPNATCCVPWETPVHAVRGTLDFIETERRSADGVLDTSTEEMWTALQDSGFRVGVAGASDLSCIHHYMTMETPRTVAAVDPPLTYDRWLEALHRGRYTVVEGPRPDRLFLWVNGVGLGGELTAHRGDGLIVTIEMRSPTAPPVEILANGHVAATLHPGSGHHVGTVRLEATTSAWIYARTRWVLTNPVYVVVDGQPVRASADHTCHLARYVGRLRWAASHGVIDLGSDSSIAWPAYDNAYQELQKRFREAGGDVCNE